MFVFSYMCIKKYVVLHLHVTSLLFIHIGIKMVPLTGYVGGVIIKTAITDNLSIGLATPVDVNLLLDHPLIKHSSTHY